jgi:hypothetical protein
MISTSRTLAAFRGYAALGATLLMLGQPPPASAATLVDFANGGAPEAIVGGLFSVHRIFSADGIAVDVSAWANTGTNPAGSFAGGHLGRYDSGLGVCNRGEAAVAGGLSNCVFDGGLRNQVDNVGQHDLVLFVFSETVRLDAITIDPFGAFDRDLSYWIGNVSTPLQLAGLGFGNLAGLGFGARQDSFNGVGADPLTIALGGVTGNALLVGARYPADGLADKFKIRSLEVSAAVVPVPAAGWLLVSAVGGLGALRTRARRR